MVVKIQRNSVFRLFATENYSYNELHYSYAERIFIGDIALELGPGTFILIMRLFLYRQYSYGERGL